jgi:acyl carrier protein
MATAPGQRRGRQGPAPDSGADRTGRKGGTVAVLSSIGDFARYLADAIEADDPGLNFHQPFAAQLEADSVQMVELAIVLEQDLGIELPEDLDLRQMTLAGLYQRYAQRA